MTRRRHVEGQGDLFASGEMFPVRRPVETTRPVDVLRIKMAMGEALKAHPDSAEIVAAKISAMTGRPLTTFALYSYTAPSRDDHDMGLSRFVAFVRVTGAYWLWDLLVEDDGLTVLQGREAKLAQLGHLQQQKQQIDDAVRELKHELDVEPVEIVARRRPRR
jgi:hypothetical protein